MIVNFRLVDGYEFRGRCLYLYNKSYYIDVGDCYLVVPWDAMEHTWVSLEDFMEAQKQAREDSLEKHLNEARKALSPKHESNGYTWSEV